MSHTSPANSSPQDKEPGSEEREPGEQLDANPTSVLDFLAQHLTFVLWFEDSSGRVTEVCGHSNLLFEGEPSGRTLSEAVRPDLMLFVESLTTPGSQLVQGAGHWLSVDVEALEGGGRRGLVQEVSAAHVHDGTVHRARRLEAIGQLTSGIAHDFNNLLTVILTYTDSLLFELPEIDPRRRDVEEIRAAANRATQLTRQLLAFSKQERARPELVNLNESLDGLYKLLRRLLGANIELKCITEDALGVVMIDPGSVDQIIVNLVIIARDSLRSISGRIVLETANVWLAAARARPMELQAGHYVRLSASYGQTDESSAQNGHPINDRSDAEEVSGLASIYEQAVQAHGGVVLSSGDGRGRVDVFLPLAEGQKNEEGVPRAVPATTSESGSTILLVEDDPALRRLACRVLRDQGYNVLAARDGEHALAKASLHDAAVDLIVTDVVMPRMGGQELARQLQRKNQRARILFTSGYNDPELGKMTAEEDTRYCFLPKPYTRSTLLAEVSRLLSELGESQEQG